MSPPPRRPAPKKRKKKAPNKALQFFRWSVVHIRTAPVEVWGMVLVFTGAAAALGVYSEGAGPIGAGLAHVSQLAFGRVAVTVPVLLMGLGTMIVVSSFRAHAARILAGSIGVMLALGGVVHLARGNRPVTIPIERLQNLGGIFGALIARPLSGLAGAWLAWTVMVLVIAGGILVITRTPVSRVASLVKAGVIASVDFVRGMTQGTGLFVDDEEYDEAAVVEPIVPSLSVVEPVEEEEDEPIEAPEDGISASRPAPRSRSRSSYRLPGIELLARGAAREISVRSIEETTRILEETLDQFQVDARVTGYTAGPTVTRFEVELGAGVKVNRVLSLSNEIKYALASGELRFLAPIPGRSAIGIEVPNRSRQLVTLGDVLASKGAQQDKHPLSVALGQDIEGDAVMANLTEMPHVLIAGATNSGKSSCINSIITSLLMRSTPDQVRMILIDPKRVELTHFAGVPHLLTPVVTVPKKAATALNWVVREMEMRYEILARSGMRNLEFYNEAISRGAVVKHNDDDDDPTPLPYILVVVDELSDLMMVAPRDVEAAICRIAQMARAVGIHLIVATQRPSVDVVTGVIKANIPSRLAFSVASQQDSRVILDQGGADKLIGHGDMLFLHANSSKARRIQGSWVTEKEIAGVVGYVRRQGEPEYIEGVTAEEPGSGPLSGNSTGGDELLEEALDLVVRSKLGSTSMLQRKLQVGFARAGRIMDLLEQRGIVGPSQGSKPRDVLMTIEELEARGTTEEPV